jgi:hypothetical protein
MLVDVFNMFNYIQKCFDDEYVFWDMIWDWFMGVYDVIVK